MEKFLEKISKAEKSIRIADHIIYKAFQIVKDKRLLLRSLTEIKNSISYCIEAILQFEFIYKRIDLYKDPKENFRTFKEKCAKKYKITKEEINVIINILELSERHKKSSMEFIKNDKVIILSEKMESKELTIEKSKEFLKISKEILRKVKAVIVSPLQ